MAKSSNLEVQDYGVQAFIWTTVNLYGPKFWLCDVILDLCPIGQLTYIHLDIVLFHCVELSIWTDPKLRISIVQMNKIFVNSNQRPIGQSKIPVVDRNLRLSKSTVVVRNSGN